MALDNVDIWLQDEARFGQQNTTTKLWAEKGTRPRAVKQQQFEYAYLFGSVCITNGASEALGSVDLSSTNFVQSKSVLIALMRCGLVI